MKLYTEEQVKKMVEDMGSFSNGGVEYRMSQLTPIELPSEEEVNKVSLEGLTLATHISGFQMGAKWVIEQIKQQDNGK